MIGTRGLALVKRYEGLRLEAYLCPAGLPTIGWGTTRKIHLGDTCTEAEAEVLLQQDLVDAEATLDREIQVPLTDSMRDALISWIHNLGSGNFRVSTLRRHLLARMYSECPEQIRRWNKAKNPETGWLVELPGLTARRNEEAELFLADGIPT